MSAPMEAQESSRRPVSEARKALAKFLQQSGSIYRDWSHLRNKVYASAAERERGRAERAKSDNASNEQQWLYYDGLKKVAKEMHQDAVSFLIQDDKNPPRLLDLCMAPGAFLGLAMEVNPTAEAVSFTLPESEGGFSRLLPQHRRVESHELDINALLEDIDIPLDSVPADHPVLKSAIPRRLGMKQKFQLIFCDGSLLRTQQNKRVGDYRERRRLLLAQLSIALQHIRVGGTMIVLLYGIEKWETADLLRKFSSFSKVQVFKPQTSHRRKGSFYMIATDVRPQHDDAVGALWSWQKEWHAATFATQEAYDAEYEPKLDDVELLIRQFGKSLTEMGAPVWRTQALAFEKALAGNRPAGMGGIQQNF